MQQIRVSPKQTTACTCAACGNQTFTEVFLLRAIPGILIGQAKEQYMPIPVFECAKCGTLYESALAPEVKEVLAQDAQKAQESTKPKIQLA